MSDDRWQLISRIYSDAVSLESAERAEFLRGACSGDSELRAEVESLLIDNSDRRHCWKE
jgi:hypothetical protein